MVHTFRVDRRQCSPELFELLVSIAGQQSALPSSLRREFDDADPKLNAFTEHLRLAKLSPWFEGWRPKAADEYRYRIVRKYTHSDFLASEYLHITGCGSKPWQGWLTADRGTLQLVESDRPSRRRLSWFARIGQPICVQSIKERFEREQFVGLRFRPAILVEKPHLPSGGTVIPWEDVDSEPWWQVISDIRLPRLSPKMVLTDVVGRPERDRGVWPREGAYEVPELHYRESELRSIGPFDVAMTHEMLYGIEDAHRLVVSRRFYALAHELGLTWDYTPVRLDDGE